MSLLSGLISAILYIVTDIIASLSIDLKERFNIYLTMIWFAILSLNLMQQESEIE
jgi:hypothetical membrane protein